MSLFPKVALRHEVENYLKEGFLNKEVVLAFNKQEAERKFETLLNHLSHPPSFTTVRVNTHLASVQHVKNLLFDELHKQFNGLTVPILQHPNLQDVLLIPVIGPRKNIAKQQCEAIVGAQCGNAVLRGAHVYVPGIVSASKFMKAGDVVSVYSDIKGKCKKGAKEFDGVKVFLGNGISELSRRGIFSGLPERKGIGIRMTEPVYLSPSFDNVLPSYLFLQNLPSAVVTHVLDPQPGEKILDLCAAPGGKTTHIAALMHDQGEVIALDKLPNKVKKIKENALLLGLHSIRAFCFDGTKALKLDMVKDTEVQSPRLGEGFYPILQRALCDLQGQTPATAFCWALRPFTAALPWERGLGACCHTLACLAVVLIFFTCSLVITRDEGKIVSAFGQYFGLKAGICTPHLNKQGMQLAGCNVGRQKALQRNEKSALGCPAAAWRPNTDCSALFIAKIIAKRTT
ncbi:hypothetical protein QTO34_008039 [Cnephaeus nilssonii]|uniref:SAM-dependent MTase RsmB/NOP-type domain-containing protein n=1 Tax=Cnephaeus nilssonii TaxID=3371016 RepID=A0AA40I9K5_CNENI|nr:hypothetical protein QTO34_008039 [Eptesicus nilssonii]